MAEDNFETLFKLEKLDVDKRQIFGWASTSAIDGVEVVDKQDDIVPIVELEKGVYGFMLHSRQQGDMHAKTGVGDCIESMVFTPEKEKLGLVAKNAEGKTVHGWWIGFKVSNDALWADIKAGKRPEFSIGGTAIRT